MLDQCQANLEQWKQIDEEIKRQKEMGNEVDALAFLDKVMETSEKIVQEQEEATDIEDKNWQEAYWKKQNGTNYCRSAEYEWNKVN